MTRRDCGGSLRSSEIRWTGTDPGPVLSQFILIYMLYFLVKTLLYGDPVQGFPTLIVVILLLGGMLFCSLGIIGEYVGRIFNETKKRPVYIVAEKRIDNEE